MSGDTTQTFPRDPQTAPGNTTCQRTTTEVNRHHQTSSNSTCKCLLVSSGVCWCLLVSFGVYWCLLASFGVCWPVMFPGHALGASGGCKWKSDAFGVYLGSQSLQHGAKILIWQTPERCDFLSPDHTETFRYQNLPMWPFQKWLTYAFFCIS